MPKITLTRQVTDNQQRVLGPGNHTVSASEAMYYRQMGWTDQPPIPDDLPMPLEESKPVLVEIPEDWQKQHLLVKRRIARAIDPSNANLPAKDLDKVIRAELRRREGKS